MESTDLLRYWFTFDRTVQRSHYVRHGFGLAGLKYLVDASLVWLASGSLWTPADYLQPVPLFVAEELNVGTLWLAPALALWTVPFLWIGVTMTIRRLLDAGHSAWWMLLFFVPFVSWALIAWLSFRPTAESGESSWSYDPVDRRLPTSLLSMAIGAALGLVMIWLSTMTLNSYGLSLFMGTPFAIGLVTAYLLNRRYPANGRETVEVVVLTIMLVAGAAFLLGMEGAVCLMMVAPLGVVLGGMGGLIGRFLARLGERPFPGMALLVVLLPTGAGFESVTPPRSSVREVRTEITIAAPPDRVWQEVVAFSRIPPPTEALFRVGLAYPTHAEIEGTGVGAIRYCVFSTGSFVEPITAWEPGRRLAFDVVESPPPLRELSPWSTSPPHLEGYLLPRRGEFRLVDLGDGRTRLVGSTWYEQRLRPTGYWVFFSDHIIGQIHGRVLHHIAASVENAKDEQLKRSHGS